MVKTKIIGILLSGFCFILVVQILTTASKAQAQPIPPAPGGHPSPNDTRSPYESKIVGGKEAEPGAWPWQVALVFSEAANPFEGQFCGGSILNEDWIVTAAHCMDIVTFDVVAGVHNLKNPEKGYQRVAVERVVVHPNFDEWSLHNDIALVKLANPLQLGEDVGELPVHAINLAESTVVGQKATATGWGNRDPIGSDYPETLHQVTVPILSNEFCNTLYPGSILSSMLCAGVIEGGRDSCQGDSGGPLVVFNEFSDTWQLAGITSWGSGCAQPFLPGVYTRVASFAIWIGLEMGTITSWVLYSPIAIHEAGAELHINSQR